MIGKINREDIHWHQDKKDVPGLSADDMKKEFDQPAEVLMEKTNELIGDLYGEEEKAGEIPKLYDEIDAKRRFLQDEIAELSKDVGKNFNGIRSLEAKDEAFQAELFTEDGGSRMEATETRIQSNEQRTDTLAEDISAIRNNLFPALQDEISMQGERKQNKLTAGKNIEIADDVISALTEGVQTLTDPTVNIVDLNGLYRAGTDMISLSVSLNGDPEPVEDGMLNRGDFIFAVQNGSVYVFSGSTITCYMPRSDVGYDKKTIRTAEDITASLTERLNDIESIAKGRATGYVFDTVGDMQNWLSEEGNADRLNLGDNLYIRDVNVPDYWWDADSCSPQPLETQKVDLTNYVKNTDYATRSKGGVVCYKDAFGVYIADDDKKILRTKRATKSNIDHPNTLVGGYAEYKYKPIVPCNLDYAVIRALTNPQKGELREQEAWTVEEQAAAKRTLGINDIQTLFADENSETDTVSLNGLYYVSRSGGMWVSLNGDPESIFESLSEGDFIVAHAQGNVYIFSGSEITCYVPRSDVGYDKKTVITSEDAVISAVTSHSWTEAEIRQILDNMADQALANKIKKLLDWMA